MDGSDIFICIVVLIETYWNVNQADHRSCSKTFWVLIETYWNVNPLSALSTNILAAY